MQTPRLTKGPPTIVMNIQIFACVVTVILILSAGVLVESYCPSPQYLELGSTGIINCSFPEQLFVLYWYNSRDIRHDDAILILQNSEKSGEGFDTGEFDVHINGSLIIDNVSLIHERTFTAVALETPSSFPIQSDIRVVVIARTFSRFPQISNCDNVRKVCFQEWTEHSQVACEVRDAKTLVPLAWLVRTIDGDRNISYNSSVTNKTSFFTSSVSTVNPFVYSSLLTLLVCKTDSETSLLERDESLVMFLNKRMNYTRMTRTSLFIEIGEKLALNCSATKPLYLVWQLSTNADDEFENILYAYIKDETFVYIYTADYLLDGTTTLTVSDVRVEHGGTYRCIASSGMGEDVNTYDVSVYINPSPAYPIVEGCSHRRYCVLEAEDEGFLTCVVRRIRPVVELQIRTFLDSFSGEIEFFDQRTIVKDNGETFDISLTSRYRVKDRMANRITIKCSVVGEFPNDLDLTTKFDILILTDKVHPSEESFYQTEVIPAEDQQVWIIIVIVLGITFGFLILGGAVVVIAYRRRKKSRSTGSPNKVTDTQLFNDAATMSHHHGAGEMKEHSVRKLSHLQGVSPEEVIPMIAKDSLQDKAKMFLRELKLKYELLYDAVQPIPYIRDRLYCVDRVFVEGGIEYLVTVETIAGRGSWDDLQTYHNIFNDARVRSTRRILEGEPGYGKSTLALQLAYDWCNKISASALSKVDIFILLRLRQLGGVKSIYRAIKQFLLPKDSGLSDGDVETIIRNSSSVVVVLDGFDEYPDQDSGNDSDVIDIIMKKMFQQFEVILTTRSSFLPKDYPPQTKRIKLTGFDDRAREQYIRKAVVGDDLEAADKIKRKLKDNAVLAGLCQVPLFFVMFAHISHESEHFQKFNSVTSFFRYMISCFHSHMKNKMKDENVKKFELFETDHKELDTLAFEGLSGKDQQIVWTKKELCKKLGQDFYNQYVSIGILVEEDVLAIADQPGTPITEHVQYQTEVRFYHKLFCEWYAAHYLAEYAAKDDVTFGLDSKEHYLENVYEDDVAGCNLLTEESDEEPTDDVSEVSYLEDVHDSNVAVNVPFEKTRELTDGSDMVCDSDVAVDITHEDSGESTNDLFMNQIYDTRNADPVLTHLDPIDVQFLYRFACGLNPTAGRKIIEYLKTINGGEKFAILCLLEQEGNVENLLETVRQLCSSQVQIASSDNLLLQRSMIQLLEIAASNKILISSVKLLECFQSVDLKEESLCLSSVLQLPRLDTLQEMVISEDAADLRDSARDILDYCARCDGLKTLKFGVEFTISWIFRGTLLPQSFEDRDVLASLYRKNTKVQWECWNGLKTLVWILNLTTGKWENEAGKVMTNEEYESVAGRCGVHV